MKEVSQVPDVFAEDWTREQVAVMEALRDWVVASTELNQHLADWTGLPTTDANALGQIIYAAEGGRPLSPARLARRIGMTSGATTTLLNRLERTGHVERSRESDDRRRVTLRPSEGAREIARRFSMTASTEIAATLRGAEPGDLRTATAFLHRMTNAADEANTRLSERRRARADAVGRVRDSR